MAAWKQLLFALVILVAAAAAWVKFFPGAPEILARWGVDWAQAAVSPQSAEQRNGGGGGRRQNGGGQQQQATVVTAAVTTATINDRLQTIGTGRAKATVTVNPYTAGRITRFLVASGAHVEQGQTIAELDSENEAIAVDREKVAVQDAEAKLDRVKSLRASNAATPVAVTDAEVALSTARLAQREAELALSRRAIVAPIAGVVGILPIEAGNYVTSTSAVATIDDRSSILVDFWVPERFAGAVKVGAPLKATPISIRKDMLDGVVTAIDNRVDEKSRTLWVQATIANAADSLRAGMSFEVSMQFAGDTFPAVSPLAIQWGADGAYIWTVEGGKAKRVQVRIIQRNTENVLVEGQVASGDIVVTEGVQSVSEGGDVRVANSDEKRPAQASGT